MNMKTVIASIVLALGGSLFAQQPVPNVMSASTVTRPQSLQRTTTFSDQYCAGFISKEQFSRKNIVGGGIDTPDTARFNTGDYVFIMGEGLKTGDKLSVVRELRDPNRYELFKGEQRMLRSTGQPYGDVGHVTIIGHQNNSFIGMVDFSCEPLLAGDLVVPMMQRAQVNYELPSHFERFPPPNKDLDARIVMAKDFDFFVGNGEKVYLNVGSQKGVKVGDYFRITRSFTANMSSEVDALSYKSPMGDDTQKTEPQFQTGHDITYPGHPVVKIKDFPRVALGEAVVLSVTPTSSTAMVTFALQDMHAGDMAEKIPGPNDTTAEQK